MAQAQNAKRPYVRPQPSPETLAQQERQRRRDLHILKAGLKGAREQARSQLGRNGTADLLESAPPEQRCRVGYVELFSVGPGQKPVRSVRVRGTGSSWAEALDDAKRARPEQRR